MSKAKRKRREREAYSFVKQHHPAVYQGVLQYAVGLHHLAQRKGMKHDDAQDLAALAEVSTMMMLAAALGGLSS